MIHTYSITGMTCDGCLAKVEKTLNTIEGIEAKVSLNPAVATITMEKHIPTEKLQEAIILIVPNSILKHPLVVVKDCCVPFLSLQLQKWER